MSSRLLQLAAHRTRTLALVAVAVLAGATGGVWAVAGAPSPGVTVTTVADESGDAAGTGDEAEKPDKPAKADKPEKPEKPGKPEKSEKIDGSGSPDRTAGAGVHGACVSAVARSDATGGKNDNHGGAVSQAAHTCPPKDPGADRRNPTP